MSEIINTETIDKDKPQSVVKELVAKHTPKGEDTQKTADETAKSKIQLDTSAKADETKDSSLVTEELANEMGLPKGFIGRPLSEVGKSYKESKSWANTTNQELIQLKADLENLKGQVSQTQLKKAEEDAKKEADIKTEDLLGEIPDSLEDPEGFNQWLLKRDSLIAESLRKEFRKELKEESEKIKKEFQNNPALKTAEQMAIEKTDKMIIESIQNSLPEGIDANALLTAWLEEIKDDFKEIAESGLYANKPQRLVKDVLNWFKAQSYDSLKNQKESDLIKKIHKKTKENLEKASKVKPSAPSVVLNKDEQKSESVVSKMVENLRRRAGLIGD